jgi:hypothetical protein
VCLHCAPSRPLRAQGEAYVNEAFYVGFPHPDVGCLYDLYFVLYV